MNKKNILMISPRFFGYEIDIKEELERLNAKVYYFDDRPTNTFFMKVCIRLNLKALIKKEINDYYNNIIEKLQNETLDYLFLVNPETVPSYFIDIVKENNPSIKIYTYFWDSINNRKKALTYLNISDKFFTFDSNDKTVDTRITFLPLFYSDKYKQIADSKTNISYDICFIGTVHSNRYNIVKSIEKIASDNNLLIYSYFYSPSKILFLFQKLFFRSFRHIKLNDISFKSLSKNQVIELISSSKVIIDIEHISQNGLTMRTIEMLGANKKILTTNKNIVNYDFYNSNNCFVFDRNNIKIDQSFFKNDFNEIDEKVYDKYSLSSWIEFIFTEKKDKDNI